MTAVVSTQISVVFVFLLSMPAWWPLAGQRRTEGMRIENGI
jgi:hypothetical protein